MNLSAGSKRTAVDSIGFLVGNLNAELLQSRQPCLCTFDLLPTNLFNGHDHLYGVKTVKTQVVVKVRFGVELSFVSHFYPCRVSDTISKLPLKHP